MGWIVSNERPPAKEGHYRTQDSKSQKGFTLFKDNTWFPTTGHPIEWWYDGEPEDTRIDKLEEALQELIDAIPKQDDDHDWWPDDLNDAVTNAKKLLE